MSPSGGLGWSALLISLLVVPVAPGSAPAQSYDPAVRSLDLGRDPLDRSSRLIGMGRLTWVVADPHNRITLWDFARNPTGLFGDDTSSTFEVRPSGGSLSTVRDRTTSAGRREDQVQAGRDLRLAAEGWRRPPSGNVYGFIGEASLMRRDRPFNDAAELRNRLEIPQATPMLNGPMPYVASERMRYALRVHYGSEASRDEYRSIVRHGFGKSIDGTGQRLSPPDFFTPDRYETSWLGGGVAASYRFGRTAVAALGYDHVGHQISGANAGNRYQSETREPRRYHVGQATVVGSLGPNLQWGADGRGWRSDSEVSWLFTISAGVGGIPLNGRGKLLEREEEGTELRSRARWELGPLALGAGLNTGYRKITITPPGSGDRTSFNAFRNEVFNKVEADSLALPDSVFANQSEQRRWEAGGGLSLRLPGNRGVAGVEFHYDRDRVHQTTAGDGPWRVGWDARAGLEFLCTSVLQGRLGYLYRWEDLDELTRANEFVSHTATVGVGLRPQGASWTVESAYAIGWHQADYGDPGKPRGSRQHLAAQVRWSF